MKDSELVEHIEVLSIAVACLATELGKHGLVTKAVDESVIAKPHLAIAANSLKSTIARFRQEQEHRSIFGSSLHP